LALPEFKKEQLLTIIIKIPSIENNNPSFGTFAFPCLAEYAQNLKKNRGRVLYFRRSSLPTALRAGVGEAHNQKAGKGKASRLIFS
jgi:hypothetical protein